MAKNAKCLRHKCPGVGIERCPDRAYVYKVTRCQKCTQKHVAAKARERAKRMKERQAVTDEEQKKRVLNDGTASPANLNKQLTWIERCIR